MNLLILLLCSVCLLDQVFNTVGKKEMSNIVLSGGSGGNGCKHGGSGALVMESGKKGKKNEKLIMKDDTLIMQNGEADGNIIMDGNNLIFKEGKKEENIIIKGNTGHCCEQETHKEEHIHMPPLPIHLKKKIEHHHHTKEVHHHNDDLGLGSRRKDANNDTAAEKKEEDEYIAEQSESVPKRTKFKKKKIKIRKLKLGDKLSLKEKEHLKLKRVDKRFGLPRFKLAGKMIQKIRWRKNAQKTNSSSHEDKPRKEVEKPEQTKNDDEQQDNTATTTDQQYEDEDPEDPGRDQEDETSNSYEGITGSMYQPILNPVTGYMTSGFNNMMDLYPPVSEPLIVPVSSKPKTSVSDRRDLKKKIENNNVKKFKKSDNINDDTREDNDQKIENEKLNLDQSEEMSKDQEDDSKLSKMRSVSESRGIKSIDHNKNEITTVSANLRMKNRNLIQPLFAIDERQLTPALFSLLSLATNAANQNLAVPNPHPLNHRYPFTNNPNLIPTATLPLFTPAKPSLDHSAALLLELIGHQSNQQKLIIAQHQKLLEQEAKQKELTKKLQQAQNLKNSLSEKSEYKDKIDYINGSGVSEEVPEKEEKSKLLYENELNHWDKQENDDNKYEKPSINLLHRRKLNLNRFDQSKQVLIKRGEREKFTKLKSKVSNDDEFDFSDFDEDLKLETNKRLNKQQLFLKRMYTEPTEFEENKLVANGTFADNNSTNHSDYKAPPINVKKQARNASLIVYGY